eukprot:gene8508-17545_t
MLLFFLYMVLCYFNTLAVDPFVNGFDKRHLLSAPSSSPISAAPANSRAPTRHPTTFQPSQDNYQGLTSSKSPLWSGRPSIMPTFVPTATPTTRTQAPSIWTQVPSHHPTTPSVTMPSPAPSIGTQHRR